MKYEALWKKNVLHVTKKEGPLTDLSQHIQRSHFN